MPGIRACSSGESARILEEFARQMPDLTRPAGDDRQAWATPQREQVIEQAWPQLENDDD